MTQADLNAGTALVNVASVDTAQTAPQQDDATSTVAQSPALTIVKELTNADDAVVDTAGETIEYTITVDNTGNVDLTNVVRGRRVCRRRTLVSGDTNNNSILETTETWVYSADYVVTQADLNAGTALVNVAGVDTDQTARVTDDATSTVAQSPALTIVKDADKTAVMAAGEIDRVHDHGRQHRQRRSDRCGADGYVCRRRHAGQRRPNNNSILETTETWRLQRGLRGDAGRPERRHRSGERGVGRHRPDRPAGRTTPPPRWRRARR